MTAVQLNAEILRNLGALAEDESMLKRVAKYLRKLVSEKEADPTLLSKEEFFARLDKAEKEIAEGKWDKYLTEQEKAKGYHLNACVEVQNDDGDLLKFFIKDI